MAKKLARRGTVIVPRNYPIMRHLELPQELELPTELPEPHEYRVGAMYSVRRHERAHHRMVLTPVRMDYERREVLIPIEEREFAPFVTQWKKRGQEWHITHHHDPSRKVDRWMNKRMRDWKDPRREDPDHSRANALQLVSYRNPNYASGMYAALNSGNPRIVGDTALYLFNRSRN